MTRSFELQPLGGFSKFQFIRPPVSDGFRVFGVQTDGTVISVQRDAQIAWARPTTRPWGPLTARVRNAVRGDVLLVSDRGWTALELVSGAPRWHVDISAGLDGAAFDADHIWAYQSGLQPPTQERPIIELAVADGSITRITTRPGWGRVLAVTHNAVIALEENLLTSIDRMSGAERWSLTLERPSSEYGRKRAVALAYAHRYGSRLLVPLMGYGFVAVDLNSGLVAWDADLRVVGMESVLAGDRLHVQATWRFVELDATTGAVISDVEITGPAERRKTSTPGPLVHHDGVLYAANRDGTVFGWDIVGRRLVWSHALEARVEWSCPPQIFLGALWIMDAQGAIHPFELPTNAS